MFYIIVCMIVFGICFIVALKKRSVVQLCKIALSLVTNAEMCYGTKTGSIKYSDVYLRLTEYIPTILRPFISDETLQQIIERAKIEMDDILSDKVKYYESLEVELTEEKKKLERAVNEAEGLGDNND